MRHLECTIYEQCHHLIVSNITLLFYAENIAAYHVNTIAEHKNICSSAKETVKVKYSIRQKYKMYPVISAEKPPINIVLPYIAGCVYILQP